MSSGRHAEWRPASPVRNADFRNLWCEPAKSRQASGDKFYVKDLHSDYGHHVEVRGQDNVSGDGYRCWEDGGTGPGWQVCDSLWDDIAENATVPSGVSAYEGSDLLWSGPIKLGNA
ncbi:hypothetical protein [Streptomyces sp. NBC_01235]|uniref:hypothetical protein n=1 Tax=Streptomyces sp. NBC_01235 TaxID=2903788 RepID=UPI002E111A1F|nr:hypothetical protein OG289_19465 [Streptomyces sp. NBC_01235]